MLIVGGIVALALGIYIGLGMPGMPGPQDRVVPPGTARRFHKHQTLDWLRPQRRR